MQPDYLQYCENIKICKATYLYINKKLTLFVHILSQWHWKKVGCKAVLLDLDLDWLC